MKNEVSQALLAQMMEKYVLSKEEYKSETYGNGHINDTFLIYPHTKNVNILWYVMQRIDTTVFKNPVVLMQNISGVTEFLRADILKNSGNPERETLTVLPDKNGDFLSRDSEGGYWRNYIYIKNTASYDAVDDPTVFCSAGAAFGRFMKKLAGFSAQTLHITIPKFHDTRNRFENLQQAVLEDTAGKAKYVQPEIDFFFKREKEYGVLLDLLETGDLPLRVTHNDTKLNNVLFDADSGKGLCVVDLDTVMPGLSLYDFGDSIRFGASTAAEDETDLSKVSLSLELFEAYTKGYLSETADVLTSLERELLPMGAKMMTMECGMRFLTDYLSGNVYFKIKHPQHNLDRARTQIALAADMEKKWDEMVRICK